MENLAKNHVVNGQRNNLCGFEIVHKRKTKHEEEENRRKIDCVCAYIYDNVDWTRVVACQYRGNSK